MNSLLNSFLCFSSHCHPFPATTRHRLPCISVSKPPAHHLTRVVLSPSLRAKHCKSENGLRGQRLGKSSISFNQSKTDNENNNNKEAIRFIPILSNILLAFLSFLFFFILFFLKKILGQLASSSTAAEQIGGGGVGGMRKNPTMICAPIMADSVDKMIVYLDKAKATGADLAEIRLDSLKSFNPDEDLQILTTRSPLPTLFTYRCI